MKRFITLAVAAIMVAASAFAKEKLNVLYVGGAPDINTVGIPADSLMAAHTVKTRMADFTKFLKQHFTKVTAIEGKDYTPEMSDNYDVTVFDGKPKEITPAIREFDDKGRITRFENASYLPSDFDNACVMIAEMSEDLGRSIGTKNDWYCLCLENYALGWKKEHPVFNGPFKVNIQSEMLPTPSHAKEYEPMYGYKLPDETEMWMVHTPATQDNQLRIGMVSRPGGYLDSPDTEVISGGKCAKSIDAVAIGRHGNFLHWGFAAKPSDLTPAGREALANAIYYIKDFNGKRIIARKLHESIATRDQAKLDKYIASRECWEEVNKLNMDFYLSMDSLYNVIQEKKSSGEELLPIEKIYADLPKPEKPEQPTYTQYLKSRVGNLYPIFGEDEAEYARYYAKNEPYFYPTEDHYGLRVDQEARALGIANNDIRLLDKAIELLANGGEDADTGKTILERYTLCRFSTPAEWKSWLDKNRDRLFFTEAGGWLWLANSEDPNEPTNDYSVLKAEKADVKKSTPVEAGVTDRDNPVALSAEIVDSADDTKELVITMTVHDGFHTYATLDDEDPFIPTEITINLPEGCEKVGSMILPKTTPSSNATTYYTGTGQFRQKIKGGKGTLTCSVRYQACDASMCMMPDTKNFELTLK